MLANITNDLTNNVPFQPTRPTKTNAQVDSFGTKRPCGHAVGGVIDAVSAPLPLDGHRCHDHVTTHRKLAPQTRMDGLGPQWISLDRHRRSEADLCVLDAALRGRQQTAADRADQPPEQKAAGSNPVGGTI
jgi:hypothetical protein